MVRRVRDEYSGERFKRKTVPTHLVVQEHANQKDKRLINSIIKDGKRTINNVRIEVKQKDVVDTKSRPNIRADAPEPVEYHKTSASSKHGERCASTDCCFALVDKAPNTIPAYPDGQDSTHAQAISKAAVARRIDYCETSRRLDFNHSTDALTATETNPSGVHHLALAGAVLGLQECFHRRTSQHTNVPERNDKQ